MLLVLILVVQTGYHWLRGELLAKRLEIAPAEPGYMENTVELDGVIARSERVVSAPHSGVLVEMLPHGERVAKGVPLVTLAVVPAEEIAAPEADINHELPESWWDAITARIMRRLNLGAVQQPEEQPVSDLEMLPRHAERTIITSEEAGFLSYFLDGWEDKEDTALKSLSSDQSIMPIQVALGTAVEAGQPILKIVNNWYWRYLVSLPLDPGRSVAGYEQVAIVFDFAPHSPATAWLKETVIDAEQNEVHLSYFIEQQIPGFDQARRSRAVVSIQRQTGLIVPEEALVEQDGVTGVFLNSGGLITFAPLTLLRLQEGRALVKGIEPYALVIGNPELVRPGQRLN
jgi:biotin carboxyl carrier protein